MNQEQIEAIKQAIRDTLSEYISVGDINDSDYVDFSIGGTMVPIGCRNWMDYAFDEKYKLIEEITDDVIKVLYE